jgi:SagB-type dehydrogenase family enzyme
VTAIRTYHNATVNSFSREWDGPEIVPNFTPMDPQNRPDPFKRYPEAETVALPDDLPHSTPSAAQVLSGTADVPPEPYDLQRLSRLLFFMDGVTRAFSSRELGGRSYARAAPSAGNLHPIEIYGVTGGWPGLDAGVYHVAPLALVLERLRSGDHRSSVAAALGDPALATSSLFLILTGIPFRTGWKYAERGLRHLYWDAGTMLANALVMAGASGWQPSIHVAFADAALSALLGLDGVGEFPLAILRLAGDSPPASAPPDPDPIRLQPTLLAPAPIEFPLVSRAQRAGDLDDEAAVAEWRNRVSRRPVPNGVRFPGEPPDSGEMVEHVILRRGSTRLMQREEVPRQLLDWPMGVAARPIPWDLGAGSLLWHVVAIHSVEGIAPGFYRWRGGTPAPIETGDEREIRLRSRHLCLEQPLGGDSAYTVFHCTDVAAILESVGARGYRAAQLEAGIVSGRLGLASFALGFGATALTFVDDEVAALLGADCMLVTAVGVPAYRSKPGGPPGRPAQLTGALRRRLLVQLDEMRESGESENGHRNL